MIGGDAKYNKDVLAYLRHLTTLSTGAIVLQVGFLEKLFPHPHWKGLIAASIVLFTATIVSSVVTQTIILRAQWHPKWTSTEVTAGIIALLAVYTSFLSGLLAFVVFALRNLFTL